MVVFTQSIDKFLSYLIVWFLSLGYEENSGLNLFFWAFLREDEFHASIVYQLKN